jgi:hypothetical protein
MADDSPAVDPIPSELSFECVFAKELAASAVNPDAADDDLAPDSNIVRVESMKRAKRAR